MPPLRRLLPLLCPAVLCAAGTSAVAQPAPPSPPPPPAPPAAGLPQVAPVTAPDPALEAALRQRLFAGPQASPPTAADPDTTEWEQARATGARPACGEVGPLRYLQARTDLNGDGQPEILALVVGSYACGSGGCTLMILRSAAGGLEPVHESGLFQSPLRLLEQAHEGWRALTMPGSRMGVSSGVMELRRQGGTYRPVAAGGAGQEPPATAPVVLTMPAVPFEQLGNPLPCEP
ncbi:MAG: hypothetical protein VKI81_00085 [Synechococcaceae cyanobacterium]|nr:hypothetical protein [Synechococcaceae cyanobacterium]